MAAPLAAARLTTALPVPLRVGGAVSSLLSLLP
jgi:hypothetical protein